MHVSNKDIGTNTGREKIKKSERKRQTSASVLTLDIGGRYVPKALISFSVEA